MIKSQDVCVCVCVCPSSFSPGPRGRPQHARLKTPPTQHVEHAREEPSITHTHTHTHTQHVEHAKHGLIFLSLLCFSFPTQWCYHDICTHTHTHPLFLAHTHTRAHTHTHTHTHRCLVFVFFYSTFTSCALFCVIQFHFSFCFAYLCSALNYECGLKAQNQGPKPRPKCPKGKGNT